MSHVTMERPADNFLEQPNRGWLLRCARCGEVEPLAEELSEDRPRLDGIIRAFVDLHRDCPEAVGPWRVIGQGHDGGPPFEEVDLGETVAWFAENETTGERVPAVDEEDAREKTEMRNDASRRRR